MTTEPKRRIGPPARCARCKCLAECPIEFCGSYKDSKGTDIVIDGVICEGCYDISRKSLVEFFDRFRKL